MQELSTAVDKYAQLILEAERHIWKTPETGFKEYKTSAYMEEQFEKLGYKLERSEGITGFITRIDTGRPGPELLILAELDSVICPAHPEADPETGAVHACGHNAQCATLLGIAAALTEPGILDKFSGRIRLCAVPAEELLEIEYRSQLIREGKLHYFGGKTEYLFRGMFDGVDLAFMVHTGGGYSVNKAHNGCMAKRIIYKGKACHAASAWDGHNALYAANCGMNAVNAIRETFKDSDKIRVHPIITHGGDMVNAIPGTVRMESYVRGTSFEAIVEANKRVNQALTGAALSLNANVEIIDFPGYAPQYCAPAMMDVAREAAALAIPEYPFAFKPDEISSGSTDMGDLAMIMPIVQPFTAGSKGPGHGAEYQLVDPKAACVDNAKFQLAMVLLLMGDGAKRASQIVAEFKPQFPSKEAYLAYVDALFDSGDRITYAPDGTAQVRL